MAFSSTGSTIFKAMQSLAITTFCLAVASILKVRGTQPNLPGRQRTARVRESPSLPFEISTADKKKDAYTGVLLLL